MTEKPSFKPSTVQFNVRITRAVAHHLENLLPLIRHLSFGEVDTLNKAVRWFALEGAKALSEHYGPGLFTVAQGVSLVVPDGDGGKCACCGSSLTQETPND